MVKRDENTNCKYPHFELGKGRPYDGVENPREESEEAVATFMAWRVDCSKDDCPKDDVEDEVKEE